MVDIDDSIVSTTTVTPGKLSLGEGLGGTATLTIANNGSSDETYTLGAGRSPPRPVDPLRSRSGLRSGESAACRER